MKDVAQIQKCLESGCPTLFLEGFPRASISRVHQVLGDLYGKSDNDRKLLEEGFHHDVIHLDGRELPIDEARSVCGNLTAYPVQWEKRFLLITYLDRMLTSTLTVLLKSIEEPPAHLSTILMSSRPERVLPTILSRSMLLRVNNPLDQEVESWLKDLEEPKLRALACGGDPEVAELLDLRIVKHWRSQVQVMASGQPPLPTWTVRWKKTFTDTNPETQYACWSILMRDTTHLLTHPNWLSLSNRANQIRERVLSGRQNEMSLMADLAFIYAQAKTFAARR